jgi:hypothetical protein
MEPTIPSDVELRWRNRLNLLAAEASRDHLPCIEQALLVAHLTLELPDPGRMKVALIFGDLAGLIRALHAPLKNGH